MRKCIALLAATAFLGLSNSSFSDISNREGRGGGPGRGRGRNGERERGEGAANFGRYFGVLEIDS